jgi:O-antigen/teichoic acid export membrane protein
MPELLQSMARAVMPGSIDQRERSYVAIRTAVRSPLGIRVLHGFSWSLGGAILSRMLALLASIAVARTLGQSAFGQVGMIQGTVGVCGIFGGFGLSQTATRYIAEFRDADPKRASRIIVLSEATALICGSTLMLVLMICAPWLAQHSLAAPALAGPLRVSAVLVLFTALTASQTGCLMGCEAFNALAKMSVISGALTLPFVVIAARMGGVSGAVWGLVIGSFINWLLNVWAIGGELHRRGMRLLPKGWISEWPILVRFSLPSVLGGTLVGPVAWWCTALLVNQPHGYAAMGIFNVANQWRIAILFVPGVVGSTLLPILTSLYVKDSGRRFRTFAKSAIGINAACALLATLPVIAASKWILAWYGPDFRGGEWVLVLMAIAASANAVAQIVSRAVASMDRMWFGLGFELVWSFVALLSGWLLIPRYRAEGLALTFLLAGVIQLGFQVLWLFSISDRAFQPDAGKLRASQ